MLVVAAACSAGGGPEARTCANDAACGPGAWCQAGTCVVNGAPTATIQAPSPITTNREVAFTATVRDPDRQDAIVGASWSVAAIEGGCAADEEASSTDALTAIFWCPGRYRVSLVLTDTAGVEGTAALDVTVEAASGAPTVVAGPALSVAHRCAGEPLACAAIPPGDTPLQLTATAIDPDGGAIAYEWTTLPPEGTVATATLSPSATAREPAVELASSGTALAGDWTFRVRARDESGLVAQAVQVVRVENGAPEVQIAPVTAPHHYAHPLYVAEAEVAPVASDPDGDPLTFAFAFEEPVATGCAAELVADGAAAALRLVCTDPAALIGLERAVSVAITDANGAVIDAALPLAVLNGPPEVTLAPGVVEPFRVDHSVAPCDAGTCFVVGGESPFVVSDPDGDPVTSIALESLIAPSQGVHSTASASIGEDGKPRYQFATPIAYAGEFRYWNGTSAFSISGTVSDPWQTTTRKVPIHVGNRPPGPVSVWLGSVGHGYDKVAKAYTAGANLPAPVDPDGDPVTLRTEPGGFCALELDPVAAVRCRLAHDWESTGASPLPLLVRAHVVDYTMADPWEAKAAQATITVTNAPPTIPCAGTFTRETCRCACTRFDPETGDCLTEKLAFDGGTLSFNVGADANGDALVLSVAQGSALPSQLRCVAPSCAYGVTFSAAGTYTIRVAVADGVDAVPTTTCSITAKCSGAGGPCY
jgi:hypothetical protein